MRSTQYGLVLVAQVFMLCALFTFGGKVIADSLEKGSLATETSEVQQPTKDQGVNGLLDYLSR